ncbi:hypothetical protein G3N59_05345 [Paraburkholderia sp. Ac-20340]|uniref:replication/maintenance protein RepL n=1 Tax=Paraburkholderia sp. Ac-20340 TaxID=2703888 RepID=UPI001981E159|nr:hypothetical protein [Paraburkholderia sp. Ac-20340]
MSTKFQGQQRFANVETGEILDAQVVLKTAGDVGFHKIWLHEILSLVDEVGNSKMQVLMWLLSNADSQNRIIATQKEIADATKTSLKTVQRLMHSLAAANVINEVRRTIWRLNPDVIFKGDHNQRTAILIKYRNEADLPDPLKPEPAEGSNHLRLVE